MKRAVTVLVCLAVVVALAAFLGNEWLSSAPLKVPERPSSVPSSAVWIGGEWVRCARTTSMRTEFTCEFYDDLNGKKLHVGRFVWQGKGEAPLRDGTLLEQPGWDGSALSFDSGQLVPEDTLIDERAENRLY